MSKYYLHYLSNNTNKQDSIKHNGVRYNYYDDMNTVNVKETLLSETLSLEEESIDEDISNTKKIIITVTSFILNLFNILLYRYSASSLSKDNTNSIFNEVLIFTWRSQVLLILIVLYLLIAKSLFYLLSKIGIENKLLIYCHKFKYSLITIDEFIYSFKNTLISFFTLFSSYYLPVSLLLLIKYQDNYIFSIHSLVTDEGKPHKSNIIISFFCTLLFITGLIMILFSSINYYIGYLAIFSCLTLTIYENTSKDISSVYVFQLLLNILFFSMVISTLTSITLQLVTSYEINIYELFFYNQVNYQFYLSCIVSFSSVIFLILSNIYSGENNTSYLRLIEIILIHLISLYVFKFDFTFNNIFYFGVLNLIFVIFAIDYKNIFNWLTVKDQNKSE